MRPPCRSRTSRPSRPLAPSPLPSSCAAPAAPLRPSHPAASAVRLARPAPPRAATRPSPHTLTPLRPAPGRPAKKRDPPPPGARTTTERHRKAAGTGPAETAERFCVRRRLVRPAPGRQGRHTQTPPCPLHSSVFALVWSSPRPLPPPFPPPTTPRRSAAPSSHLHIAYPTLRARTHRDCRVRLPAAANPLGNLLSSPPFDVAVLARPVGSPLRLLVERCSPLAENGSVLEALGWSPGGSRLTYWRLQAVVLKAAGWSPGGSRLASWRLRAGVLKTPSCRLCGPGAAGTPCTTVA